MPYKNKEDRNEAVRRCRERKKEAEERYDKLKRVHQDVRDLLKEHFGFQSCTLGELVRDVLEDLVYEDGLIRSKSSGKNLNEEAEVLFGLNTMVVVDTVHMWVAYD